MAITYVWKTNKAKTKNITLGEGDNAVEYTDVVDAVDWELKGIDSESRLIGQGESAVDEPYSCTFNGTEGLDTNGISNGFIDFNSLSTDQLQAWVEASLGQDRIQEIKDAIEEDIANQKNFSPAIKSVGD